MFLSSACHLAYIERGMARRGFLSSVPSPLSLLLPLGPVHTTGRLLPLWELQEGPA